MTDMIPFDVQSLVPMDTCETCGSPLPHKVSETDRVNLKRLNHVLVLLDEVIAARFDHPEIVQALGHHRKSVEMMIGHMQHGDPPSDQEVNDLMQAIMKVR